MKTVSLEFRNWYCFFFFFFFLDVMTVIVSLCRDETLNSEVVINGIKNWYKIDVRFNEASVTFREWKLFLFLLKFRIWCFLNFTTLTRLNYKEIGIWNRCKIDARFNVASVTFLEWKLFLFLSKFRIWCFLNFTTLTRLTKSQENWYLKSM